MSDPFSALVPEARAFLGALAADNGRAWFTANKATYDAQLKTPAILLLDQIAHDLRALTGQEMATKLFRPHRDVRFSKDKTPYNTHLHMLWSEASGAGYFFGIAPDYVTAGAGVMGLEKDALIRWRDRVAGPAGAEVVAALDASGGTLRDPELKRVPSPFDKDHPRGELLRRKGLVVWFDLDAQSPDPLTERLMRCFSAAQPVQTILRGVLS